MMDDLVIQDERTPGVNCPICKSEMTYTALLDMTQTSVMCLTESCKLHFVDLPRDAVVAINQLIEARGSGKV